MNKHEKNILIQLSEQQKDDITMLIASACVRALKVPSDSNTPETIDSLLNRLSDILESELATIYFKHMKEIADKDDIIENLSKQVSNLLKQ